MGAAAPDLHPSLADDGAAAAWRHWRLRCRLALADRATRELAALDELLVRFPVLRGWIDEAALAGLDGLTIPDAIDRLDARGDMPGPLARLRAAFGLAPDAVCIVVLAGLVDDDPRLVPLVDALGGHAGRPTRAMWPDHADAIDALQTAGVLGEEPGGRSRGLVVPAPVWAALRGALPASGQWRVTPHAQLPSLAELILPAALHDAIAAACAPGVPDAVCWAIRGSAGSGRRTIAAAIAQRAGIGLIEAADDGPLAGADLRLLGVLGTLAGAMPLLALEPAPGERVVLPELPGCDTPIAVRMPGYGGLAVHRRVVRWLEPEPPAIDERRRHWARALSGRCDDPACREALAGLLLTRGAIHRIALAVPSGCVDPLPPAMREVEQQGRFRLDGVAHRVAPLAAGEPLALGDAAQAEFDALVARCRHREALGGVLPAAFGHASVAGVRALFKGPSGTGKTLAARHLAARIGRPLYRVDLAATVSKYIGETERNLERVFEAAEALDIVLLLDEGDALLAGRTGVTSATDRYANLETNYLLQRLEAYRGILVVTTNAAERIDTAFARRIDVTLEFALPDAPTRHALWRAHLPAAHAVSPRRLDDVALRCALSGGQIRNAALHATLLSLDGSVPLDDTLLLAALRREYRKAGQACPSLGGGR